ncbi:MAG: family 10 glycosylhydrolase [Elusimicrobiota bacterium]
MGFLPIVVGALLLGPSRAAAAGTLAEVFHSTRTVWTASGGDPAVHDVREGLPGTLFSCDYTAVSGRCTWDAPASIDLTLSSTTDVWIHVENAEAIGAFTLYFRSGGGWYRANQSEPAFGNGWNRFVVQVPGLGVEGSPTSLAAIDLIRVSPWKAAGGSGRAHLFVTVGIMPSSWGVGKSDLADVFSSTSTFWRPTSPAETAKAGTLAKGPGWTFSCDFSRLDPIPVAEGLPSGQCLWTAGGLALSLSPSGSISGWVFVENAAAVRFIRLNLRSGLGYYSWTNLNVYEGWNRLELNMRDAWASSGVSGWNGIDLVGVVVTRLKGERVSVAFADMAQNSSPVSFPTTFAWPERDTGLTRLVKRDAAGRLIENRAILDEAPFFLGNRVDSVVDQIAQAGFNVYIPVIWHGRGAIYASTTVVLDARYASQFQGSADPFAELIQKAHSRGVQVQPWFTVALRETNSFPEFAPAGTPNGAYDLQDPAFRDFIVDKVILDVARRYDVDGINLDYIRTIGTSFTDVARARYLQKYGVGIDELSNPYSSPAVTQRFLEWQDAAVTDVVSRISAWIKANKPWLVLSISGHPLPSPQLSSQGRNERNWVASDSVDLIYGMDYDQRPNISVMSFIRETSPHPERFPKLLGNYNWVPNGTGGVAVTPRPGSFLAQQVEYFLRKFPGRGIGVYIYSQLHNNPDQINALRAGPFKETAIPDSNGRSRPDSSSPSNPKSLRQTP